jgi:hypothetical protein
MQTETKKPRFCVCGCRMSSHIFNHELQEIAGCQRCRTCPSHEVFFETEFKEECYLYSVTVPLKDSLEKIRYEFYLDSRFGNDWYCAKIEGTGNRRIVVSCFWASEHGCLFNGDMR